MTKDDFKFLKVIGRGGFGIIFQALKVRGKNVGKTYAVKMQEKKHTSRSSFEKEKQVLF